MDLVIAATANVHGAPLVSEDLGDLEIIGDLVDIRSRSTNFRRARGELSLQRRRR
jgi:hypothetical protein